MRVHRSRQSSVFVTSSFIIAALHCGGAMEFISYGDENPQDCVLEEATDDDAMAIDCDFKGCGSFLPSSTPQCRKRKYSELVDDEQREDLEDPQIKAKIRRTVDMKSQLGKSIKQTVWYSCLLQLDRHELVPCRILCKEAWAWMVQLKEHAELQGRDNAQYQKGFKFWVKWNGHVVVDEHLPLVYAMHRA